MARAARGHIAALAATAAAVGCATYAAPANAVSFGADLSSLNPSPYGYSCGDLGAFGGCSIQDPLMDDMELVLPDPVVNGNQTGIVTAIHVKAAASGQAQFVAVEWSGKPGQGNPFPSGVMAVSAPVTLQPGINNFNTNLPVDWRLASNGYESWSSISLNILDGSSPLPVAYGGSYAETGVLLDNGSPLTTTVSDLTLPPHWVQIGALPPGRLLMSGDVTITTGQTGGGTTGGMPGDGTAGTPGTPSGTGGTTTAIPQVSLPRTVKVKGNTLPLVLRCAQSASCGGTLRVQSRAMASAAANAKGKIRTYATGPFSVAAGKAGILRLKLSNDARNALKAHRSLIAYANTTYSSGRTSSFKLTIKN